jgi:hypothetical protein
MRWEQSKRSDNVQDRRGRKMAVGGGIGAIVVTIVALMLGVDPTAMLQQMPETESAPLAVADEESEFVAHVLGDTEEVWSALFAKSGEDYPEPTLILFSGAAQSACGYAQAAVGPFYCPRDKSIYIDLSFFELLRTRFAAPGDFAEAYVIAHEVGHHVQNITGQLRAPSNASGPESQSVRTELQADCYAGVWAHHAQRSRNILERGDVEEALGAASAIGDDALQKQSQGQVVPESFTHGTSAQRVEWFRRGLEFGDVDRCRP